MIYFSWIQLVQSVRIDLWSLTVLILSARYFLELSSYRVARYGLYRSPDKWLIIEPSRKRYSVEVPFRPRRRSRRVEMPRLRNHMSSPPHIAVFCGFSLHRFSSACLVHDGHVTSTSQLIGSSRDFAFSRSRATIIRHQRPYIWILNIKWTFIDDNFVVNVPPVILI